MTRADRLRAVTLEMASLIDFDDDDKTVYLRRDTLVKWFSELDGLQIELRMLDAASVGR